MVFGFFKRAVSVFTGQSTDSPEVESAPASMRVRRPSRAGLRARFEDDDNESGTVPITPARRKRAVSESAPRPTPAAKRPRVAVHSPSQPRAPKKASAPKRPSARRTRRPSLPSPPTSSPRTTRSTATRALQPQKSQPASSSESESSDEDCAPPRRLPLAVKTPTKAPLQPLFINDDGDAQTEYDGVHEALRAENLERTLSQAKPHLLQEVLAGNTWLVVFVSSMLDAHPDHQRKEVMTVFCSLSARWPTADAILSAPADEVKTILTPFASYQPQLQTLAAVFVRCPITSSTWRAQSCWAPPYTPYVRDAYRTFCVRGEWQKVRPKPDSDLAQYLQWRWARSGKMWDAQYGPVGQITTSQVRTIVVKCWAPLFHALPYSLATRHPTSSSVRIVQPST